MNASLRGLGSSGTVLICTGSIRRNRHSLDQRSTPGPEFWNHSLIGAAMIEQAETTLTPAEQEDLRRLAGFMVPASAEYRVPGADDETIFADIVRSLGRDLPAVKLALATLCELADGSFTRLDPATAEATAMTLLARKEAAVATLGRVVLQCYYRDDRVFIALGLEPRPPFPKGHMIEPTDWSLLDGVRSRPRMWRDVDRPEA